ncbi:hypothetical protein [Vreelandella neptunia]|uniref:Peroxin-14 n=1 Tax=Vreelandella neptunia TaxID=115551 RepID=A0ABZ0YK81_9GAMM|nr:hypothetical protein [Halomonas neptunia]MDN3562083.1 hypothetical protein [Halomonas neptunia]WQH11786.1 hypothetical protein SR894_16730 [Halomonas neptunia]
MAIPWLIGGAIVAAAAAITAAVADDSSSGSSDGAIRDEERKLKKEHKRKETLARKEELQSYADRVTKNLAKKYGVPDEEPLRNELATLLSVSSLAQANAAMQGDTILLQSTVRFKEQQQSVTSLQKELQNLEGAMSQLETLNDEFK